MNLDGIEIEWKGHAGVFIDGKKKIYIDPYKLGAGSGNEKADIILLTHPHYDHCSVEDLGRIVKEGTIIICTADCQSKLAKLHEKIDVRLIEAGGVVEIGDISVRAVPAYNINKKFHDKSEGWAGYIVEIGGKRIYHAGDTDLIPEMQGLSSENIDIAFLPVGGTYTMNADEAANAARIIKPKLAVPIHFGEVAGSNEDALRFKQLCEQEGIRAEIMPAV